MGVAPLSEIRVPAGSAEGREEEDPSTLHPPAARDDPQPGAASPSRERRLPVTLPG